MNFARVSRKAAGATIYRKITQQRRPLVSLCTSVENSYSFSLIGQRSSFHSSPTPCLPVRRRRRNQKQREESSDSEDNTMENPLKHPAVEDTLEFTHAATQLLDKLEKALEPMKARNDIFIIKRWRGDLGEILTIDLGPKDGSYRIEISEEESVFEYTSPISGKVLYVLSASTGEWVGFQDGHLFEGLLVRDLIRQCQGLPNL